MGFPTLAPSSRQFSLGEFPTKAYRAMDGFEIRLLYGSKMTRSQMSLTYNAISDQSAELFIKHYKEMRGNFETFDFVDQKGPKTGWGADPQSIGAGDEGNKWRYEKPPTITSVRPGVSNVSVSLVAALV